MSIGDETWQLVHALDVHGVLELLRSADDERLAQARAWFRSERPAVSRQLRATPSGEVPAYSASFAIEAMLLIWLGPPAAAARQVEWSWLQFEPPVLEAVPDAVVARGSAWGTQFLAALDPPDYGTYPVIRALCDAFDLDHPTSDRVLEMWLRAMTPHREWSAGRWSPVEGRAVAELVRSDRRGRDLWAPALASPQLGAFPWYGEAVAVLALDGDLERSRVIDAVVTELTAPGRPKAQRVLVRVLEDLDVTAGELPGGLPMLQGLVATLHGSATAPLLPLAIELLATGDDLTELAATVVGRPEKKQRRVLLSVLLDPATTDRLGTDVVRASLELYAGLEDAAVADRARTALGPLTPEPTASATTGLWERAPDLAAVAPPMHFGETLGFESSHADVVRRAMLDPGPHHGGSTSPWLVPAALEILVRWAHDDGVGAVREGLRGAPLAEWGPSVFGQLVTAWVSQQPLVIPVDPRNPYVRHDPRGFVLRHLVECLSRLGKAPFLLSTPSYGDGTLDLSALTGRLRRSASFGPLDLALAVLRTRPVDPDRAAELADLDAIPPATGEGIEATSIGDAATYVREAVGRHGLRMPLPDRDLLEAENWLLTDTMPSDVFWQSMLPVDLGLFDVTIEQLVAWDLGSSHLLAKAVAPFAPDLRLCRDYGLWRDPRRGQAEFWGRHPLEPPGLPGVVSHMALLNRYVGPTDHERRDAVELTVELIGTDRYSPEAAFTAAALLQRRGHLNLARCAAAWEQVFLAGGLKATWRVALTTAAISCQGPRKPPGLPDLFRLLARYTKEVPDLQLPDQITQLAAEKGSTKSHAEARALVRAVGP